MATVIASLLSRRSGGMASKAEHAHRIPSPRTVMIRHYRGAVPAPPPTTWNNRNELVVLHGMKTIYAVQNSHGQINEEAQNFIDTNVDSGAWDNEWDTAPIEVYDSVQDWHDTHTRR